MNSDLTVIVPYRGDPSGERARNAIVVLRHFARRGAVVVLVEHSASPDEALELPLGANRIHVATDGPFSKAVACNVGFAASSTSVIALVDADMLIRGDTIETCVRLVRMTGSVIRPFGLLKELPVAEVASRGVDACLPRIRVDQASDGRDREQIPLCGGLVLMPASTFERVGGLDERFLGWGGEDDALSAALMRASTGVTCRVLRTEAALHLRHSRRSQERYHHAHYIINRERAAWWWQAPESEIQAAMADGRVRLDGYAAVFGR